MKKVFFIFLGTLVFFLTTGYSIDFTTCNQTIPTGTHYLSNDVNSSSGNCFEFDGANVIFDCQGHTINNDGSSDNGFYVIQTNITIKNCIIANFSAGIKLEFFTTQNNTLQNITAYNNVDGITIDSSAQYNTLNQIFAYDNVYGVYFIDCKHNTLNNSVIYDNTNTGVYLYDVENHTVVNTLIYNNTYGIYIRKMAYYNTILSSQIYSNSDYNVYFDYWSTQTPQNNTFYQNYLGNVSKIGADDWSQNALNYFNSSNTGNFYSNYNYAGCSAFDSIVADSCTYRICTDNNQAIDAANGVIDYKPIVSATGSGCFWTGDLESESSPEQTSPSIFPFEGLKSMFITLSIIVLSFIIF